ncbi:CHAT domain-containing protein [Microbispora triticiradicis]|uniref:CHAT domain-containing protein n=1 Tax=Microbispora triticiradicis TaxID=2200763 RepID=UPI001AD7459A|nr:CHAT domain-containing protein [Microbispora triticiradicis]
MAGDPRDPLDLLPLVFSQPRKALAGARALLAARPGPFEASVAHHVLGLYERDFGDLTTALGHLRRARALARRTGSAAREADVLATLGIALVHSGRTRPGLAALDQARARAAGVPAAKILFLRAGALWILGRHREALDDLRRALPELRGAGDTIWTARALTLRATLLLALGSVERADQDFLVAERLWATTDQEHDKVVALENRGRAAFRSGDLPAALGHFDEAARRYLALGTPAFVMEMERCAALMAAGLPREALERADASIDLLDRTGGQPTRRAQLLFTAAGAALAAGDPETAIARVRPAIRLFAAQKREWWETHARLTLCQARFASGRISPSLARDAAALAATLSRLGSPEDVQAFLLAGRAALALGRAEEAAPHLARAARGRFRGPAFARADGWLAHALRAESEGRPRGVLDACRRGLDVLDEHRLTLGASELRARATARGAELAALAQRVSRRSGDARRLLAWSERWRATALAVPPARSPGDRELLRDVTAFREIASRADAARSAGAPVASLDRERARLEREIRGRTLTMRARGEPGGDRFDAGALLRRLGGTRLVEIAEVDGDLHVLLCGEGRVRGYGAGRIADAAAEVEHLRAGLRRLAYEGAPRRLALVEEAGRRLQDMLFGPAARHLGEGPIVIVPPGRLHGVPWAVLPALRDRVVSVSPSARAWLRAVDLVPPPAGGPASGIVLVRGPGLGSGGGEVPPLARLYGGAAVLEEGGATASAVLKAIDGARLAHIAAHGIFRADSPMFSSLRMADGPLTVYEFERLGRAPHRIILPSCDSGGLQPVGADELLGLAAALLPLGTAGIVAGLVPVHDEAVIPLMLALHAGLSAGRSTAEALRDARREIPDDPLHRATAWSFTAIGAA